MAGLLRFTPRSLSDGFRLEFNESETEFTRLSLKSQPFAMLIVKLLILEDRGIEFLTIGHHVINDPCQFVGRSG